MKIVEIVIRKPWLEPAYCWKQPVTMVHTERGVSNLDTDKTSSPINGDCFALRYLALYSEARRSVIVVIRKDGSISPMATALKTVAKTVLASVHYFP